MQAFWGYKPDTYLLDGQERTLFSLTFANAGQFGNGAWMAPDANIADGKLDQCAVRPFPLLLGGFMTWRMFNKTISRSSYWQGRTITNSTVQASHPLLIHADGEPLTLESGRAAVRVLPGSLLVLL